MENSKRTSLRELANNTSVLLANLEGRLNTLRQVRDAFLGSGPLPTTGQPVRDVSDVPIMELLDTNTLTLAEKLGELGALATELYDLVGVQSAPSDPLGKVKKMYEMWKSTPPATLDRRLTVSYG